MTKELRNLTINQLFQMLPLNQLYQYSEPVSSTLKFGSKYCSFWFVCYFIQFTQIEEALSYIRESTAKHLNELYMQIVISAVAWRLT